MARFSSMLCGSFIVIGALTLQAQTMRPTMPVQRPNPPGSLAPQIPQPATAAPTTPTPAPGTTAAQPAQPAGQPTPLGPPIAPVVTYRDGLLSVQALNSNLSSVVTAIRNKTGIEFEGAEGISERVAIALGPAPEGDILAAIFAGSKYDFLAIGRADSPTIVQKVILTVKNKPGAPGDAQAQQQPPAANKGEEEEVPEEQPNAGEPQDTPVQPPVPQPPPQAETPPNKQPKTPEQLLQELQEMRRQKGSPEDPTNNPNPAPRKMPPR
jgi:hypothetical protein